MLWIKRWSCYKWNANVYYQHFFHNIWIRFGCVRNFNRIQQHANHLPNSRYICIIYCINFWDAMHVLFLSACDMLPVPLNWLGNHKLGMGQYTAASNGPSAHYSKVEETQGECSCEQQTATKHTNVVRYSQARMLSVHARDYHSENIGILVTEQKSKWKIWCNIYLASTFFLTILAEDDNVCDIKLPTITIQLNNM